MREPPRIQLLAAFGAIYFLWGSNFLAIRYAAEAMPPLLTSSTARDIAAGAPSELDAITGAAVRAGRRLGVDTPVLSELFDEACRAQSR